MNESDTRILAIARPLAFAAIFLEGWAYLSTIGGVIAGIAIAVHTRAETSDSLLANKTTHPFVALGIGLAVGAFVVGVFNWCIAQALQLYANDVAFRHGASVREMPGSGARSPTGEPSGPARAIDGGEMGEAWSRWDDPPDG